MKKQGIANIEKLLSEKNATAEYSLCLYISGASPNSIRAVNNLKQVCEEYLKGRYTLEIIDVHQQADLTEKEQIIALPLLIKRKPKPIKRLIGDMSEREKVLKGLGLI